jgi:hypothetical protein
MDSLAHALCPALHPRRYLIIQSNITEKQKRPWGITGWIAGATGEEHSNSFTKAQILAGGFSWARSLPPKSARMAPRRPGIRNGFDSSICSLHAPKVVRWRGLEPAVLRWNGLRRGRLAPFIELAGGGVHTNANLPSGNTSKFNFTAPESMAAFRYSAESGDPWTLAASGRINANLGAQNPEFNGIQVSVAYHWFK